MSSIVEKEMQDLFEKLHQEFLAGLNDRANLMERSLLGLEKDLQSKKALAELFRLFHSLKGTAGSYGEHLLAKVCHQFENILQSFAKGFIPVQELVQIGLCYIDFIRSVANFSNAADELSLQQAAEALPNVKTYSQKKIMVCDKSRVVRESVAMALSGENLNCKFSDSGLFALEMILREPFDLLITARQLNDLSGLSLLAALRAPESPFAVLPVIMMVNQVTNDVPEDSRMVLVQRDEKFPVHLRNAVKTLLGLSL